jgi:hypothetical protein
MMDDAELKELAKDIKANGMQHPLVLNHDASILIDGRNRLTACNIADMDIEYECLPADYTEQQILDYIVSSNIHRRQLTAGQKAMIAAELEPMYAEAAKVGRPRRGEKTPADSPEYSRRKNESREQAAKHVGASGRSTSDAKALKDAAPDLAAEVKAGKRSLNNATKERKRREQPKPKLKPKPAPQPKPIVVQREWNAPQRHDRYDEVVDLYQQGMTIAEIGKQTGLGRNARHIIEREAIELDAYERGRGDATVLDWDSLPGNMTQKAETMRRQVRRELEAEFEPLVQAEVQNRLKGWIERTEQERREHKRVLDAQRGVFTKSDYNQIWSCLHPDSRQSTSKEKLDKVFKLFDERKSVLLKKEDRPAQSATTLPTLDELMRRRKRTR